MLTTCLTLLWRCTVLGALTAGAAFALRGVLILFRAPRRVFSLLWAAVLFRLLCPLALCGPVSLFATPPLAQTLNVAQVSTLMPEGDPGDGLLPMPDAAPLPPLRAAAAIVWALGAAGLLGSSFVQYLHLRRRVRFVCKTPQGHFCGQEVDTPFILGLVRPRIYLPTRLSPQQTAFVLAHEKAHLRAGDHLMKPLFYLAVCLHWFNPVVWLSFACVVKDMEQAADEAVLRTTDCRGAADYCQSLLDLSLRKSSLSCPVAFGEGDIPARIRKALAFRAPHPLRTVLCTVLCAALCVACAANPLPVQTQSFVESLPEQSTPPAANVPPAAAPSAEAFIWPVPDYTYVSRWMGDVDAPQSVTVADGSVSKAGSAHKGSDLAADEGADILAMADGTVSAADYNDGYGWYVTLTHADGYETLYAHCLDLTVTAGDSVKQGDVIAHVGNTGASTGDHCHVECSLHGERFDLHELFPDK